MYEYPVKLTQDGGSVLATFRDIPEAITFGENESEALTQSISALETALSFYVQKRQPLPVATKPRRGELLVAPTALECAKLGLYQAMLEQGVRKADLARRLGWHAQQVDRLIDLTHKSKFEQLEIAANELGKSFKIEVVSN